MKQITCPHCADTYPDFDVAHVCSKGPYAPKLKPRMNERIKQLATQAGIYQLDRFDAIDGSNQMEKLAELIVRECMEQIHIQSRGPCGDYHGQWFESGILKHFGVEE